jgi:hypothetical protein
LLDQEEFFGADKPKSGLFLQGEQLGKKLAAAKPDQPGTFVFQIELAERSFDFLKHSPSRRGEYAPPRLYFQVMSLRYHQWQVAE